MPRLIRNNETKSFPHHRRRLQLQIRFWAPKFRQKRRQKRRQKCRQKHRQNVNKTSTKHWKKTLTKASTECLAVKIKLCSGISDPIYPAVKNPFESSPTESFYIKGLHTY
jgi:hypothetical protein